MVRFAWVLALAGCLSKPDKPTGVVDGDGGVSDAMSDAPPMACGSATRFPSSVRFERQVRTVRLDDDSFDDLMLFGRDTVSGTRSVFFIHGRAQMNLDCYDLAISPSDAGDLAEIWAGEITGDAHLDLAMFVKTGDEFVVELVAGTATGFGLRSRARIADSTYGWIDTTFGGDPTSRGPIFVTSIVDGSDRQLLFGGTSQPFGAVRVTGSASAPELGSILAVRNQSNQSFNDLAAAEAAFGYEIGASHDRLIVVHAGSGMVRELTHVATNTNSEFTLATTGIGTFPFGGNRTVRRWERPFDTDRRLAISEWSDGFTFFGYSLLGYHPTSGTTVYNIEAPNDASTGIWVYDMKILALDNAARPDFVALLGPMPGNPQRKLVVHRNVHIDEGTISEDNVYSTLGASSGQSIATGNFDGDDGTADQILVIRDPDPETGRIGDCFVVDTAGAQIVRC